MSASHPANTSATQADTASKVIIVEDDQSIAVLLRFILERDGFRVEHAADGDAAQRLIASMAPPTAVLLDIMLPYANGFELIETIRAQTGWQQLPILMLSGKGNERDIARAFDAGADDYIVKPFQPEELKARLRRLLRNRQ